MESNMRRDQAALLITAAMTWWEQSVPEYAREDDDDSAWSILASYCHLHRVSFGDVTYLVAVGTLATTGGTDRRDGIQHSREAVAYLHDANRG